MKYMTFDLVVLTVIGFILEVLSIKFGGEVLDGAPTAFITLLIMFIAIVRWNAWGMVVAPFLALATLLGGKWSGYDYLSKVYDWRIYISTVAGLLSFGVDAIIFKKKGTREIVSSAWLLLILLMNSILFLVIQIGLYRLLTSGDLIHMGEIIFESRYDDVGEVNLCAYGESGLVFDLLGIAVLYIGTYILRSQGVICNAIDRLVEDKKNAELNRLDTQFTISEAEDSEKNQTDES